MTKNILHPVTFLGHPYQCEFRSFLSHFLALENPERNSGDLVAFLKKYPLPLNDFPYLEGTYSRTVLLRHESGYEVMAARWNKGACSSIHGHPYYNLYYGVQGCLKVDNYKKSYGSVVKGMTVILNSQDVSSFIGTQGTFDNDIHQVQAIEETLSIHISSDDSSKGEIFG